MTKSSIRGGLKVLVAVVVMVSSFFVATKAVFAAACPTPTFSPVAGAVAFGTTVTITSAGSNHIYYTTNGDIPTHSSTDQTITPLRIDAAETVKALSSGAGCTDSAVGSAAYTQKTIANLTTLVLSGSPANYTFAAGTYLYTGVTVLNAITSVTVTPTGSGTITVDGTPVTSGSPSAGIALTAGVMTEITVDVTDGGGESIYIIDVTRNAGVQTTPTFSPVAGAIASGTTITITSASATHIYYTTDGSTPTAGSTLYTIPVAISSPFPKTLKALAVRTGYDNSAVGSAAYTQAATVDLTGLALSGSPANYTFAGDGYTYNSVTVLNAVDSITVTPTGAGVITMTLDGGAPATLTTDVASDSIALTAGTEVTIVVTTTETGKTAKTYTIKVTRNYSAQTTPTFSPDSGAVSNGTTITITSASANHIYYAINGSTPTVTGAEYTLPIAITYPTTLKALAVRAGYDNSAIGTAVYTMALTVASASLSSSSSSNSSSVSPASAPDLFQINVNGTTAKLFFTPISNTNEYYISFSTKPSAEEYSADVTLAKEGVQSYTVYLLKPNTTYYFKVRGQGGTAGSWSNTMKTTTRSKTSSDAVSFYKNSISKPVSTSVQKTVKQVKQAVVNTPSVITNTPRPIPTFVPEISTAAPSAVVTPAPKKCFLLWCW